MLIRNVILSHFEQVAKEQDRQLEPLRDNLPLLESGLDSLCLAIVVARLEDKLGVEPFSAAAAEDLPFPTTIGEFVGFYQVAVHA
jgi:acyl carrier protein